MEFHKTPYHEVSIDCEDPDEMVNDLRECLLHAKYYFPGDTNTIGNCIDSLIDAIDLMIND